MTRNIMHFSKTASFSPNNKYFACISSENKLLVWETLNAIFIDCKFDANLYSNCTSINWFHTQRKYASPKKAKILSNRSPEIILLAVGTLKGDILLYNVVEKNLYMSYVAHHTSSVNDMSYYKETNSLFTCSSDKSIAIWDFTSGLLKSKWKTGDNVVSSICVIDENNLLSASSSILWWNVLEQCIIRKFDGHSHEIFKLLPVNSVALNSCYFLSAAVKDVKINAWSSNKSADTTPVASFILPAQPADIDISKVFSKDKPLILSAITKNGYLYLFEHVLNGTIIQPIIPKVSIQITSEISKSSIISTRLYPDSEACMVAYGTCQSNMTFKRIKIKEALENNDKLNSNKDNCQTINKKVKNIKGSLVNGAKSTSNSENNLELTDSPAINYKRKLRSSRSLSTESEILKFYNIDDSKSNTKRAPIIMEEKTSPAEILIKGLETEDEDVIDAVLYNSDTDFISSSVKNLPVNNLKDFLCILTRRLNHHQKYSSALSKWLKEILSVHLNYLVQCQETEETLKQIRKYLNSLKIHATISKLSVLRGFLSFQNQNSSEESNSENEEIMES